MIQHLSRLNKLAFFLVFSFILLIFTEAAPFNVGTDTREETTPVVRVREGRVNVSVAQKERFEQLIEEGKRLLQEEMDYEGAIKTFKEAEAVAVTREQRADVCFYLSLAYYATLEERGTGGFDELIRKLIEIDYYRELDRLLCPPRYIELFQEIKKDYGALKIQSRPAGADVYLDESRAPAGWTPLTIGHKAGSVKIMVKKGGKEKQDTLRVAPGETTTSPIYVLTGRSKAWLYVLGGVVVAGGVGAALLLGKGGDKGGSTPAGPTTGSIQVNSLPTGAQIFFNGTDTGKTTNATLTDISPGSHTVKLVKEGYGDYEEAVSVTAGQTTSVNATLVEIVSGGYQFITKWGSQGSGDGQFIWLQDVEVDNSGYVYVSDADENSRILKFTPEGTFLSKIGKVGGGTGRADGEFLGPRSIAIDSSGNVYVVDNGNYRIQKFTSDGTFATKWGSSGSGDGQFINPYAIAIDNSGSVYVSDVDYNRVQKFNSDGTFVTKWGSEGSGDGQFKTPRSITIDNSGFVYVTDAGNHRIQKFTSDGSFLTKWGSGGSGDGQFMNPWGIEVDNSGYVYVSEWGNHRVQKFTSNGTFVTKWGSEGSGNGQFIQAVELAVDSSGYVYVADYGNYRIQKFGPVSSVRQKAKTNHFPLTNLFLNRNINARPGLLNLPPQNRLEKKQSPVNQNRKNSKKKRQ